MSHTNKLIIKSIYINKSTSNSTPKYIKSIGYIGSITKAMVACMYI